MPNERQLWERRSAARRAAPGKLWHLAERAEDFAPAWMSDVSRSGLAFITGADHPLDVGETLSVSFTDPKKSLADCETFRVCRIEPYGPSLRLVACTRFL